MNDKRIEKEINSEIKRQEETINLIASENIISDDVSITLGSVLSNKYAEGYCNKRYYGGCNIVDNIEEICINRACKLFGVSFANVQPYSGSIANLAVYKALLNIGDAILGMDLSAGGHLTHGYKKSISGSEYKSYFYGLNNNGEIDYENVLQIAKKVKPKLIIAGSSTYSKKIDFLKFRKIANEVGAYLLADISHIAGLIVAGLYQNPCSFADVVTSTTHKTLRGPRGAIILSNNDLIMKKINNAVFPFLQGGPHMNTIAAKAVCFYEAMQKEFIDYQKQVVKNAYLMCEEFKKIGYKIVNGGTDTHMFTINVKEKGVSGFEAEKALEEVGIIVNRNIIFGDKNANDVGGIRIGTPSITTRGFKEKEACKIVFFIDQVLKNIKNDLKKQNIKKEVKKLLKK
ncbi:MAG: serine hydroxymethyltransferase [Bacilli bacterium]|nr:serine hydroxymethyltransferase [Bacilli bacterium]